MLCFFFSQIEGQIVPWSCGFITGGILGTLFQIFKRVYNPTSVTILCRIFMKENWLCLKPKVRAPLSSILSSMFLQGKSFSLSISLQSSSSSHLILHISSSSSILLVSIIFCSFNPPSLLSSPNQNPSISH